MSWINRLKVAIVLEDFDSLNSILSEEIIHKDMKEMEESMYLLNSALELVNKRKQENIELRAKLEKGKAFLKSSDKKGINKFDASI
jgi:hypothetical protein